MQFFNTTTEFLTKMLMVEKDSYPGELWVWTSRLPIFTSTFSTCQLVNILNNKLSWLFSQPIRWLQVENFSMFFIWMIIYFGGFGFSILRFTRQNWKLLNGNVRHKWQKFEQNLLRENRILHIKWIGPCRKLLIDTLMKGRNEAFSYDRKTLNIDANQNQWLILEFSDH